MVNHQPLVKAGSTRSTWLPVENWECFVCSITQRIMINHDKQQQCSGIPKNVCCKDVNSNGSGQTHFRAQAKHFGALRVARQDMDRYHLGPGFSPMDCLAHTAMGPVSRGDSYRPDSFPRTMVNGGPTSDTCNYLVVALGMFINSQSFGRTAKHRTVWLL